MPSRLRAPRRAAPVHGRRWGRVAAAALLLAALGAMLSCADFGTPFVPSAANIVVRGVPGQSMIVGTSVQLTADVRDLAGRPVRNAHVTWSSSAPQVAVPVATGALTARVDALHAGFAALTASADGTASAAAQFGVREPNSAAVEITSPAGPVSIQVGATQQFAARVVDELGQVVIDPVLTWTAADPGIAVIDATGLAHAIAAGATDIQATSGAAQSPPVRLSVTVPAIRYAVAIQPLFNVCDRCHLPWTYPDLVPFRVTPGDPARSNLYQRLTGCGGRCQSMPPGAPLPSAQIQLVRDWILGGALP